MAVCFATGNDTHEISLLTVHDNLQKDVSSDNVMFPWCVGLKLANVTLADKLSVGLNAWHLKL